MQFAENHFADPGRAKPLNAEGIYVCSYCEPWMWRIEAKWIEADSIQSTKPLSYYLEDLEKQAELPAEVMEEGDYAAATRRDSVRAFLNSAVYGPDGQIVVNQIRAYGGGAHPFPTIEFLTSPLPTLGNDKWGSASRGLLSYNMETRADSKRCEDGGAKVDGVYFDSLGDWADFSTEDHRAEHFKFSTSPLTFSYATGTPVISGLAAATEYMQFIKSKKYWTMGNADAKYAAYVAPFLDFLGVGEGYPDTFDAGDAATDAVLSFDREAVYHKSLGFLNTGMTELAPEAAEKRIRLLMFYHIYPGLNSTSPEQMEKIRPMFKKYIPLMQAMGTAGWEPVTYATVADPAIWVERFGPGKDGVVYFAVRNSSAEKKTAELTVDCMSFGLLPRSVAAGAEVIGGEVVKATPGMGKVMASVDVPANDTVVVRLDFKP